MPRIPHKHIDGVEHKKCCRCQEWKILTHFNKNKNSWDKLRCKCKLCLVAERKQRKQYITEYNKKYWKNRDPDKERKRKQKWRDDNRECLRETNRKYYLQNLEHRKKSDRAYRNKPRNKKRKKKQMLTWQRKERKNNPSYKMKCNLRIRLRSALKGCKKMQAL